MVEKLITIAENYLKEINLEKPHMQCIRVSQGLSLHLIEEHNITNKRIIFDVDMVHFNGEKPWYMVWNIIEHECIILDNGIIIDATASQFNDPNGNCMPRIYIGPIPTFYKNQS